MSSKCDALVGYGWWIIYLWGEWMGGEVGWGKWLIFPEASSKVTSLYSQTHLGLGGVEEWEIHCQVNVAILSHLFFSNYRMQCDLGGQAVNNNFLELQRPLSQQNFLSFNHIFDFAKIIFLLFVTKFSSSSHLLHISWFIYRQRPYLRPYIFLFGSLQWTIKQLLFGWWCLSLRLSPWPRCLLSYRSFRSRAERQT